MLLPFPHALMQLATKTWPRKRKFAYICITSCAQLQPALGHKFVAGGSGRGGSTRGGRALRAPPRLFTPRVPAGSHASVSSRRRGPACPASPGSRHLQGVCLTRTAAGPT